MPPPPIPSVRNTDQTKHRLYRAFCRWKVILECTGILFAVGYALIAFLQWRDNIVDHIVKCDVPCVRIFWIIRWIANESAKEQFLWPCNFSNLLIPRYLGTGIIIIAWVVVELAVDPRDHITRLLPYLGICGDLGVCSVIIISCL